MVSTLPLVGDFSLLCGCIWRRLPPQLVIIIEKPSFASRPLRLEIAEIRISTTESALDTT